MGILELSVPRPEQKAKAYRGRSKKQNQEVVSCKLKE
jgi:hypothetical protein